MFTSIWHTLLVATISTFLAFMTMLPLSYYFAGRKSRFSVTSGDFNFTSACFTANGGWFSFTEYPRPQ